MSPFSCSREREVTELLRQGYWPDACPADLRAHVDNCRICSDLVLVTSALQHERRETLPMARLEAPGALWWRAQLRKRNVAIEKMARPIMGAQVFALAMSLLVAVVVLVWQAGNWSTWLQELPAILHLNALLPDGLQDLSGMLWIIPVLASIAVLSGVVVYLASEKQ